MDRMPRKWNIAQLKEEVPKARNRSEVIRALGLCLTGGNAMTIQKWIDKLGIDTSHFETRSDLAKRTIAIRGDSIPLEDILVENSKYSRFHLKRRLVGGGIIPEVCALCGQGREWQGKDMSLILDHINGVRDDNRQENLRLVCPNCNATLPTHCGKKAWT